MCRAVGKLFSPCFLLFIFLYSFFPVECKATVLSDLGLYVIPYPQKVVADGENFIFKNALNIVLDKNPSAADRFTAEELMHDLKNKWNILL
ncbi:hypothetical protein [Segetibacter koreensis]|uniref:hypothetical protein n=1 Tax=Segetibacter koreensis TaxID=398037 RepID=UPI0003699835|nr:hypothetical protein [Segetibacter koreensis]